MSPRRAAVRAMFLLTGTWLVGGTVAVTVGFFAIAQVGHDLTTGSATPMSDTELRAAARLGTTRTPSSTSDQGAPGPADTTPPATEPPKPADEPSVTTTTPPKAVAPSGTAQSRRFTTEGGVVAVTCTNTAISLQYAYPNNGYTSEVETTAQRIEVEFHSPGREFHLTLRCVNGAPRQDAADPEPERTPDR